MKDVGVSEGPVAPRAAGLAGSWRFALSYALIAGALFAVYGFPFELLGARGDWLNGYLAGYAQVAGALISVFDSGVVVSGTQINGRFPLQIVRTCDAAEVLILFASAMLAFPGRWAKRLILLLVGVCILMMANVVRICCLYFTGVYKPGWFRVAHEEVWPLLLVGLAALMFLGCVRQLPTPVEGRST